MGRYKRVKTPQMTGRIAVVEAFYDLSFLPLVRLPETLQNTRNPFLHYRRVVEAGGKEVRPCAGQQRIISEIL